MFDLFRRTPSRNPAARPPVARETGESDGPRQVFLDPIPLPEVIEGNEQSDWALWDSVGLAGSRNPVPSSGAPADPFANVGKNRDL